MCLSLHKKAPKMGEPKNGKASKNSEQKKVQPMQQATPPVQRKISAGTRNFK